MKDITNVLEGAEELLVEWANALDETFFSSNQGKAAVLDIEAFAASHWLKSSVGKLPKKETPFAAAEAFRQIAHERNVITKDNFKLEEEKNSGILGTFLSHDCPYRKCCAARVQKGKEFLCFRATPFKAAIKLMANKDYRIDVLPHRTTPGKVCLVRASPAQLSFRVGFSYKLSKGVVKIHDVDLQKIGIGLVDTVTIRPSDEEKAGSQLTAMSYSQSKYPVGMIILNIKDAQSLGLNENDTVLVNKAGQKEEAILVDEETYAAKPGEYDIPGLDEIEGVEQESDEQNVTEVEDTSAEQNIFEEEPPQKEEEEEEPLKEVEKEAYEEKEQREEGEEWAKGIETSKQGNKETQPTKKKTPKPKQSPPKNAKAQKDFEAQIDALRNL